MGLLGLPVLYISTNPNVSEDFQLSRVVFCVFYHVFYSWKLWYLLLSASFQDLTNIILGNSLQRVLSFPMAMHRDVPEQADSPMDFGVSSRLSSGSVDCSASPAFTRPESKVKLRTLSNSLVLSVLMHLACTPRGIIGIALQFDAIPGKSSLCDALSYLCCKRCVKHACSIAEVLCSHGDGL